MKLVLPFKCEMKIESIRKEYVLCKSYTTNMNEENPLKKNIRMLFMSTRYLIS